MAPLISAAMRAVGYRGRLATTDEESITANVGAAAISWAFETKIEAAGFATAMRMRDRRKRDDRKSSLQRHPDAGRIKVL